MPTLHCQHCGTIVTFAEPIPRDAECESCERDLRCCRNCRHFDPALNNACRETQADPVEDKARRNFCEFFYFNHAAFVSIAGVSRADDARKRLDAMFGGEGEAAPSETAKQKLEGLFRPALGAGDRKDEARKKLDALFKKPESGEGSSG